MSDAVARLMPTVRLSDDAFAARHGVLRIVLWLHLPLILAVALLTGNGGIDLFGGTGSESMSGHQHSAGHAAMLWIALASVAVCALVSMVCRSRRSSALSVSTGLILAAVALVHAGGGLTDLHFHFFVVLALVGLYQDWVAFAVGVLMVAVHHMVVGLLAPTAVFSDPRAQAHPIPWALLHAAFVIAMCAAQIAYWRFGATAQRAADADRERVEQAGRRTLEQAAEEAERREREAADLAAAELHERERMTVRLNDVLASTATSGTRIEQQAGAAMQQFGVALLEITGAADSASHDLDRAQADSATAQTVIGSLERAIGDIADVAQLIKAVADQTNLLALNATIEAARAGEAGRGFGVVAEEVKSLAGQTAGATARIEQTVAEVRSGAEAAVRAVDAIGAVIERVVAAQAHVRTIVEEQNGLVETTTRSLQGIAAEVTVAVEQVRASR